MSAQHTPGPLSKSSPLVREGLSLIRMAMEGYADAKADEDADGKREARAIRAALAAIAKATRST